MVLQLAEVDSFVGSPTLPTWAMLVAEYTKIKSYYDKLLLVQDTL